MARGQFLYSDDTGKQQKLVDPPNDVCQSISGAGAAVNLTDTPAFLYGEANCGGDPFFVVLPRAILPVPPFESVKFATGF